MSWSPNWTDEYREIVEFYWWEPQMLGRSEKNYRRFRTADEMWSHLATKEVPLNHLLSIFFTLFPLQKIQSFKLSADSKIYSARQLDSIIKGQKNFTQPDFFIEGESECLAIELKTTSKGSLTQLLKYTKFNDLVTGKRLRILMLTPYSRDKVFKDNVEGFDSASVEYLSFADFCKELASLRKDCNDIEKKLIDGMLSYFAEYFGVTTTKS
jgi:hypothetical protein